MVCCAAYETYVTELPAQDEHQRGKADEDEDDVSLPGCGPTRGVR
jgi:hypothetical protein